MATATTITLSPQMCGEYAVAHISDESAAQASKVLSKNHEENDIITNDFGHHNHIVHHILTAYALGATPDIIQARYDRNAVMQRRPPPLDDKIVEELSDVGKFLSHLRSEKPPLRNYTNYLTFFMKEIQAKGYQTVLDEYVFKGDERANIMFARLFSGTLHPLIHLGYGIEFSQPAVVAEALAQTCIHPTWLDGFLISAEETAHSDKEPSKSLVSLIDAIHDDKTMSTAVEWSDRNLMVGLLSRQRSLVSSYVTQYRVSSDSIPAAEAEVANAAAYFTACAQRPPKQVKFDFWMLHSVTSSVMFSAFLRQDWISTGNKVKLLEYKGRHDLLQYACRKAPDLLLAEVAQYEPKEADAADWAKVIKRSYSVNDDGHTCKMIRALAHGEKICKDYEESHKLRIKGNMWLLIANMVIDSVEGTENRWIRNAGFDEAWDENVEKRPHDGQAR